MIIAGGTHTNPSKKGMLQNPQLEGCSDLMGEISVQLASKLSAKRTKNKDA